MPPVKKATASEPATVPEVEKATKAKAAPKKKVVIENTVVAPVVSDVASPVAVIEKDDKNSGDVVVADLIEKIASLATHIKTIQSSVKMLVKEFDKQKKIVDKVQKKKEKAKKSPSGFAKPCKISDELCDFIGVAKGTELSRTDITRHINSYVKEHNLNNPQNRREFFPDKKLKSILNVKDGEKVTYFVLQRLIAHHFPPSMNKLAAASAKA
jgi:chromatin remodeling complex protein RSC6